MTIILNTDKHISGNQRLENYVKETIKEELARFNDFITRVEVHLSDQNGEKEGGKDKKCILEARIKNKQPIAVTCIDGTVEKALHLCIDKLKGTLAKAKSKASEH